MVRHSSSGNYFSVAQMRNRASTLQGRKRRLFEVAGEELGFELVDWDVLQRGFEIQELAVQKPRTFDWAALVGLLLDHIDYIDHMIGCPVGLAGTYLKAISKELS